MKQLLTTLVPALLVLACSGGATPTESTPNVQTKPTSSATSTATAPANGEDPVFGAPTSTASPTTTSTSAPEWTCAGKAPQPKDATWSLSWGGATRTFVVHVPSSYDPKKPTPVVLNFHGLSSDAAQQELLTKMDEKADAEGFVTVRPQGISSSWNAGACCGEAARTGIDDIGFVNAMLDDLEAKLCVDFTRVYATGMSNGGFITQRLACELSERIAAFAPVAGVLGVTECKPKRPIPMLRFHGTLDSLVPYDGSPTLGFISVPQDFSGWRDRNGCTGTAKVTYEKGDAKCETYDACKPGGVVTLCTIDGGGHTWPGGFPVPTLGKTSTDINATDVMWDFFVKHPMPR